MLPSTPASIVLAIASLAGQVSAQAPERLRSVYVDLAEDFVVGPAPGEPSWVTVGSLTQRLSLPTAATVLLHTDGVFHPDRSLPFLAPNGAAVQLRVTDHARGTSQHVGNQSLIDWSYTVPGAARQHCFNAFAVVDLRADAAYTIELRALQNRGATGPSYRIAAGSNLSIFVRPADVAIARSVMPTGTAMSPVIEVVNDARRMCAPVPPTVCPAPTSCTIWSRIYYNNLQARDLVVLDVAPQAERVVFLASGWSEFGPFGNSGDVMWGLFGPNSLSGGRAAPRPYLHSAHQATYTVSDTWWGAELRSPMFLHGLTEQPLPSIGKAGYEFALVGTNYPSPHLSSYRVHGSSSLAALYGGMSITGSASYADPCRDHLTVAGNCDPPGVAGCVRPACQCCPRPSTIGQPIEVARQTFTVPNGTSPHDGIVMFAAKARCQGDWCDDAMDIELWIELQEQGQPWVAVGNVGSQGLAGRVRSPTHQTLPTSVAQRTLSASYLAAGSTRLAPGTTYNVRIMARVTLPALGNLVRHLSLHNDLPMLIFFG